METKQFSDCGKPKKLTDILRNVFSKEMVYREVINHFEVSIMPHRTEGIADLKFKYIGVEPDDESGNITIRIVNGKKYFLCYPKVGFAQNLMAHDVEAIWVAMMSHIKDHSANSSGVYYDTEDRYNIYLNAMWDNIMHHIYTG